MMKNTKKILFPAVAVVSMMGSGNASSITTISPDGSMPLIDSAVTAAQVVQLPVGGTIYQGVSVAALGTITVNVLPTVGNSAGHCTFILSDAFGASATAPAPAATVAAIGDCSKVDLYFVQKGTATSTAYAMVRIKGSFKNVFYYTPVVPATKLTFCTDTAGADTLTATASSLPPKLLANQPLSTIPGIVYLTNADDLDQLSTHIKGSGVKIVDKDVTTLSAALKTLFKDNRS